MTSDQILKDITVVDCSIAMAGPFAAQRLGDLGADVIKVEPLDGEWQRRMPAGDARGKRINTSFLSLNRNKRSLAVNLKTDAGRELLYRLVDTADVFLQNYRPGVAERLGVDYETLRARKPDLIYVSISGFGEDGPYRLRPGQDLLLQAMSGAMLSSGREQDPPTPAGQYIVDAVTAYSAFEGALAALFHRERTGEGQRVDINMLDAIVAIQMQELSVFTVGGKPQKRSSQPHGHVYIQSPYGIFETRDHKYVALAFASLNALGKALDIQEFLSMQDGVDNHRFRDEIFARTKAAILEYDAQSLLRLMDEQGIWTTLVYGYEELVNDPQVKHNGSFIEYEHPTEGRVVTPGFPIRFGLTPSRVSRGAPLPGEHTVEILSALGFSDKEIEDLRDQAIVAETKI